MAVHNVLLIHATLAGLFWRDCLRFDSISPRWLTYFKSSISGWYGLLEGTPEYASVFSAARLREYCTILLK